MNEGLGLYSDDSVEIVFGSPLETHHLHLQYHEDFFKPNLMHQMPSAAAYEFLEFPPKKRQTKRASSTYPFPQNPPIHGSPTLSNTAQKPPNGAGAPWPKKSRTKKVKPGKSVPTTAAIWWVDFHTPSTHHVL